jgi:senataxin
VQPPTVLSRQAAKFSYEKSLFVRMQENYPQNVHLLSIQYRMHPAISAFPSREFYNSGLTDGKDMAELRRQPWHSSTIFGSYRFFNVAGSESRQKTSLINVEEAKMALALFMRLAEDFREINFDGRIGIVTPYRQQLGELKRVFQGKFGEKILTGVEFNTVDAFQGRERDIIIFSCVRAAEEGGVGFLSDVRRMNVGLTRAKSSLFILGNSKFLVRNHMWSRLVEDAKQRNFFTENVRRVFDRSSRTSKSAVLHSPPPQSPAPNRAPTGGAQQVAPHWDPMDIDLPETADPPLQKPPPPQSPSGNIPHLPPRLQQHTDSLRGPPQPRDVSQGTPMATDPRLQRQLPQGPLPRPDKPARQQQSRDEHITCHTCGQKGHRQINCPKNEHSYMNEHNAQIPGQRPPPPQLKRPAEFEDSSGNKRIHGVELSSSGPSRPSSINESSGNGSEQKKVSDATSDKVDQ